MNCRDFIEIADTYLSDELLVETNHEVFRHLEHCKDCREELSLRREIRSQLQHVVVNAEESIINPIFANKLKLNLREQSKRRLGVNWRIAAPLFASLLIAVSIGISLFYNKTISPSFIESQHELALKAMNRHEDCGIKHLDEWKQNLSKASEEDVSFVKSISNDETKVLDAHDCEFEGRLFRHFVLQNGEKVVSVIKTESVSEPASNNKIAVSIISEKQARFRVASFQLRRDAVFVISEMPEAENLNIARKLSDSV